MANSPWTRKPAHRANGDVRQDGTTYTGTHRGVVRIKWMDEIARPTR